MTSTYGSGKYARQDTNNDHPAWERPLEKADAPKLRIHNSLTGKKEEFVPHNGRTVKWYTCGPTVYDVCHMGHARAYLTFDIVRRIMTDYFHFDVEYHVNITDVDDKIILRARRNKLLSEYLNSKPSLVDFKATLDLALAASRAKIEKKLQEYEGEEKTCKHDPRKENEVKEQIEILRMKLEKSKATIEKCGSPDNSSSVESLSALAGDEIAEYLDAQTVHREFENAIFDQHARKFEASFMHDMKRLGIREPDVLTRVTEYIPQIITFVQKLIGNGTAYVSQSGSVYLDLGAFKQNEHAYRKLKPHSGPTSEVELAESEGAIGVDKKEKKDHSDFVLWKASKPGEPHWDSPWGFGRPGWHIECSVVASDVLGDVLDLHAGGEDLKFPHHDNELAQSEAYFASRQWVNYFVHAGHLQIKGLKMSKSLKNFITIDDALKMHSSRSLRMLFLIQPWDGQFTFSDDGMTEAKSKEKKILEFVGVCQDLERKEWLKKELGSPTLEERAFSAKLLECKKTVHECLLDNFDTVGAVEAIVSMIHAFYAYASVCAKSGKEPAVLVSLAASRYVVKMMGIFGCEFGGQASFGDEEKKTFSMVVQALIDFREEVRAGVSGDGKQVKSSVLAACDLLRDEKLVACGVALEDRPGLPTRWMLRNPDELLREKEEMKKKVAEEKREKQRRKIEQEEKALLKDGTTFSERHVKEMFTKDSATFSSFDESGFPLLDAEGKEISKTLKKTLEKRREKAVEDYKKLRERIGAKSDEEIEAYLSKKRQEIEAMKSDLGGDDEFSFSLRGTVYSTKSRKLHGKNFASVKELNDYIQSIQ